MIGKREGTKLIGQSIGQEKLQRSEHTLETLLGMNLFANICSTARQSLQDPPAHISTLQSKSI